MKIVDSNGKVYESINAFARENNVNRRYAQDQFKAVVK